MSEGQKSGERDAVDDVIAGVRGRVIPSADVVDKVGAASAALLEDARGAVAATAASDDVPGELRDALASCEPIMVGSVAKGTFLPEPDLDIFIPFPRSVPPEQLKRIGLLMARRVLPDGEEKYAQHPYLHGVYKGYECDVVPCYKLEDIALMATAVDRTPFHTVFIMERITPEQVDEVRLLKRFLKGIEAYGANDEIRGFSGYLAELLVLRFGTFRGVLEEARHWKSDRAILMHLDQDTSNVGTRNRPVDWKEGRGEDCAPLIFRDPTDPQRNVASALTMDRFARLVVAAGEFLRAPQEKFFFPEPFTPMDPPEISEILSLRESETVVLSLEVEDIAEDKLLSQVRKAVRSVEVRTGRGDFVLLGSASHHRPRDEGDGDAAGWNVEMLFEFDRPRLPAVKRHEGPPLGSANCDNFQEQWRDDPRSAGVPYVQEGRWMVDVIIGIRDPGSYIREKLGELNLGKHLNEARERGFRLERVLPHGWGPAGSGGDDAGEAGAQPSTGPESYPVLLSRYLDRRWPWER